MGLQPSFSKGNTDFWEFLDIFRRERSRGASGGLNLLEFIEKSLEMSVLIQMMELQLPFLKENNDFFGIFGHILARNEGPEGPLRGLNLLEFIEKSLEI